jgi:hypothetical protein
VAVWDNAEAIPLLQRANERVEKGWVGLNWLEDGLIMNGLRL